MEYLEDNIVLATDSYKLNHWNQYPEDTEAVYSYFESRAGAQFDETVFFGLQYILTRYLEGAIVSGDHIAEAAFNSRAHFGREDYFNLAGWEHILTKHYGRLPLRIKAVPEGTPVPTGNVLMTVENTDPECYWLTNAVESLLTHVWYPSTVASLSRSVKLKLKTYLDWSADSADGLPFMLHDFGYRGASSHETAAIGGAGHLVNFLGTDTLPAISLLSQYYTDGDVESIGFSVAATEHSVMTARGERGEFEVVDHLLSEYPDGILSVVADSYDVYRFVSEIGTTFHDRVLVRDGVFVVRPDSVTGWHKTPELLVVWILNKLWEYFGGTLNSKGYRVLDQHVRVLWGDGIDPAGIERILEKAQAAGFSAENLVFGMGGGLLQKVNRDTQRFAFKASAIKRAGVWHDVFKRPLDPSKASKKGRLALIKSQDGSLYQTVPAVSLDRDDLLETVFENGEVLRHQTLDDVRARAAL